MWIWPLDKSPFVGLDNWPTVLLLMILLNYLNKWCHNIGPKSKRGRWKNYSTKGTHRIMYKARSFINGTVLVMVMPSKHLNLFFSHLWDVSFFFLTKIFSSRSKENLCAHMKGSMHLQWPETSLQNENL